ncbi:c-type lysozyme inhibitor [Salmonella enterica]|uniref:c-type lysozyme inhibitor n=1 Tax=Salmonella enterica TaxID=28901 RepID=UPI00234C4DF6|nr:c-type lysozyme inhibitor [Salmonella enterica]HCZ5349533.1 c-type lysozyme inhibitor [Salmonella enterica]
MKRLQIATLITAIAVSTAVTAAPNDVSKTKYACNENKTLEVVYINTKEGNSYAIINQMDEMIPMKLMKMASGANYEAINENYTYKLYTKGKTANLVEGNDQPVISNCTTEN